MWYSEMSKLDLHISRLGMLATSFMILVLQNPLSSSSCFSPLIQTQGQDEEKEDVPVAVSTLILLSCDHGPNDDTIFDPIFLENHMEIQSQGTISNLT